MLIGVTGGGLTLSRGLVLQSALYPPSVLHQLTQAAEGPEGVNCPICGVHFSGKYHKYNLKRHMDIHRGVRPFSCHHCGQQFNRRHNLDRHMERLHNMQSQPPS
ncbi:zinc finger protein 398-like [Penaeus indicus]|uniref:zinc finger protein 398-like n=1 Tax=Penaeus indicus TaxID=29960 RepID=UPI00300D6EBF